MKPISFFGILFLAVSCTACGQEHPSTASAPHIEASIRDVSISDAALLLQTEKTVQVLDIRTPEEFAEGHIEGALNINFYDDDFKEQLSRLDRNTPYLLHCRSGGRSGKSMAAFKELRFKNIAHMTAGMNGWREAGEPVTAP